MTSERALEKINEILDSVRGKDYPDLLTEVIESCEMRRETPEGK